jgi:NAD(P)-dependent dehydrogenase (short-subunit alcohol dehydrogenase family)
MLFEKKGTIINISSDAAMNAYGTWGSYGTSKVALDHLMHIWAEELKGKNIQFFSIDPGDMDTPLHAEAVPNAILEELKKPERSAKELLQFLKEPTDKSWVRKIL